ncbi:cobalamin B12-binding domain-containing protein [Clostridium thermarum]|uniref:cobalamin B12-binding domain-containing protein n=1 Tax=Clostridium thermarum TaxID=1716543 RepID=UPI0013D69E02|nr:cobalamin-dependent protein [Clostridium thermarum]
MEIKQIYEEFIRHLDGEDKEASVNYIMDKVEKQEISVVDLYEQVLAPALNNMVCRIEDKRLCIWKEHARSAIVRTIIECCYPYVMKERRRLNIVDRGERVVIICPSEEYHELGARMGADFFMLSGYDALFIGSNTPQEDFLQGVEALKPEYIVISVSNYYNLVTAKKLVNAIKRVHSSVTIVAAGLAFKDHKDNFKKIGADKLIEKFTDIQELRRGQ